MDESEIVKLARIFDDIIGSDSRAVQEAFQRLVMLSTMAKADNDQHELGPFARIINSVQVLEQEVRSLRRSVQILENRAGDDLKIDLSNIGIDLDSTPYSSTIPHVAPLTVSQIETFTLTDMNMGSTFTGVDTITISDWDFNKK
jgi:hypothetical protein